MARVAAGRSEVVEVTDGRFRRHRPGVHRRRTCTWRSCPCAASTRSTTRSPSTCPSRSAAAPSVPLAAHTPRRRAAAGGLAGGRRADHGQRRGHRSRPGGRGRPAGPRGAGPGDRGRYSGLRAARAAWPGAAPRSPACSARAAPTWTTMGRARPWNATTCASERSPNRPRDRLVRRQRRRRPAGRARRRRAAGHAVLRQARRRGRDRHGEQVPGPVPGRPGRAVAARVRRGGADHAPGLLGPGHVRGGLGRRAGVRPAAAGPDPRLGRLRRPALGCAGRDRHVALVRGSRPRARRRVPPVGQLGADLSRDGAGRWLVDRVLPGESFTRGPVRRWPLRGGGAAGRSGGGGGRAAGRSGARAVAAAGRHRGPAGRAHRPAAVRPGARGRGGAAAQRAAAALPGLGGRAARPGPRAQRGPRRLPAHPGHDGGGLGALPS